MEIGRVRVKFKSLETQIFDLCGCQMEVKSYDQVWLKREVI